MTFPCMFERPFALQFVGESQEGERAEREKQEVAFCLLALFFR